MRSKISIGILKKNSRGGDVKNGADGDEDVDFHISEDDLALARIPGAGFDPKTRQLSKCYDRSIEV